MNYFGLGLNKCFHIMVEMPFSFHTFTFGDSAPPSVVKKKKKTSKEPKKVPASVSPTVRGRTTPKKDKVHVSELS